MRKFYFKLAGMIAMLSIATLSHAQWEQLSLEKANGDTLKNIKCITKHGGAIYIGTSDSAVWVSNSGVGGDWIPYGSPNNINVTSIAVGTNVSAIRGDDSLQILEAGNWTKKQYSGSNFKVGKVVLQESTGKLFAPQDGTGIYSSDDNGATWSLYNDTASTENLTGQSGVKGLNGENSANFKRIWSLYASDSVLLANSKNSPHFSLDSGDTWFYRWGNLDVDHNWGSNIQNVFYRTYEGSEYVFVCSDGTVWNGSSANLSRSNDMGITYDVTDVNGTMTTPPPRNGHEKYYNMCEYTDSLLFLRTNFSGTYVSYDNGINWHEFNSNVETPEDAVKIMTVGKYLYMAKPDEFYRYDLTTPINWNTGYPKVNTITAYGANLEVNVSAPGTAYYVILPSGDPAPSEYQVINGLDASGAEASLKGEFMVDFDSAIVETLIGLSPSTSYDVYVTVQSEVLQVPGLQSVAFTTTALSSNANLDTLYTSVGILNPAFNKDSLSYHVELPSGETNTPVTTATAEHSGANIVVDDAVDITSANNAERTTTVTVTAEDATTTKTYTILFDVLTSTSELINVSGVSVYPNPAHNNITIELGEEINGDVLVTISDMLGNIIDQSLLVKERENISESIDISILANGLYIITISDDDNTVIQKILKN